MPSRVVDWPLACELYWDRLPGSRELLQAIAEEPGDRALRLVLADFLEEHGEADRAEFIRLQVGHDRWADRASWPKRAAELLGENRDRWLEGLPAVPGVDWAEPRNFYGGLLEQLQISA